MTILVEPVIPTFDWIFSHISLKNKNESFWNMLQESELINPQNARQITKEKKTVEERNKKKLSYAYNFDY